MADETTTQKTLLPSSGFNVSADGKPIPTIIPNGSTITKTTNSSFTYVTPEGETKTWEGNTDLVLRSMYYNYNTMSRYGELKYAEPMADETNNTLEVLGTFSNGKMAVRESQISLIPKEERENYTIVDDRATGFDWNDGSYRRKSSTGTTYYTFVKENGSFTTRAESYGDAKRIAQSRGDDFLFLNTGSTSYDGPVGGGVTSTLPVPGTDIPDVVTPTNDDSPLLQSEAFNSLPEDQQEAVRQVYSIIAENNIDQAERLKAAFETAAKISDPFFKQQILLARDAIDRGFVSITEEADYQERQLTDRLNDLRTDLEARKDFLNLEETAALKGIEREYGQNQKALRQSLAARGMSSSSERVERERLLDETTGDLRETTKRRFGVQKQEAENQLERGKRDTQKEMQRLAELTKSKQVDLFREAEATLGTTGLDGLGGLGTDIDPIGGITGDIKQKQTSDIIQGAQNLIF